MSSNLPCQLFLILLCFSTALQALTLKNDISALISFKSSINPSSIPPWSCLASWKFSFDPCSSPRTTHFICGISCNPDSTRVVTVTLDPAGYVGILTPQLSSLSQLTHLDLSDNNFHGPIPSSLSILTNLQTLVLRSNSFSSNLPAFLPKTLQTLDISHNALTGTIPKTFYSFSNLRNLDLSFNSLNGSLPKLPANLVQLALKANSFSGSLLLTSFQGLNQLEVVELSANHLSGTLQYWFFLLPSIQQVNLANNSLTHVEIADASSHPNSQLVAVDLGFNKIEGALPINFASFPLLSALSLRYNRFRGVIPQVYAKKVSLRRLYLDGNYLNGKVPAGLFRGESVSGSFGNNCLEGCPSSSQLCLPSQKPVSVCKRVYRKRPGSRNSR